MAALKIEYKAPALLGQRSRTPHTHSRRQLSKSLPVSNNSVLSGQRWSTGRVEAAKTSGVASVPAIRVDHRTQAQIRAYVIAERMRRG